MRGSPGAQDRGEPRLVGVGLAGAGFAARAHHLPALAALAGRAEVRVVAIADPDPAALDAAGALAPGAERHRDAAALLGDPRIEVVAVATPPSEHVRLAGEALEAGRHVLAEKPLGLDPGAVTELQAAAERAGLVLGVGFAYRRHRLVRRARELLAAGAIGTLRTITATMTGATGAGGWRAGAGGVLLDLGPHQVDLWRHLTGREIDELRVTEAGDGASAAIAARLTGGATAAAALGAGTGANHELRLTGSAATLTLRLDRHDGLDLVPAGALPGDPARRVRRGLGLVREAPGLVRSHRTGGDLAAAFTDQWRDLLDAVRGGTPFAPGAADARAALEPLLAGRTTGTVA